MTADGMNTAMGKLLENLLSATAPTVARGANEHTNGLLRKYCPNDEYIEKAV